ncbi:phage tail tape measure protein [Desulfonatronovibrio magnus]|uniref:phage tail tape measure protein n=1 Tax=Desulfonatronovibrio magnus TaxID=698827 RepID=UPI0005EBBA4D|nr:phage tail tape measure protein [Desulfonatronovibrio magnus]
MATIGRLNIELVSNVARLQRDMNSASNVIQRTTQSMTRMFRGVAVAFAGAFSVRAIQGAISETLKMADATAKLSRQVGVSIELLSSYQHAANLSGTSIQNVGNSLGRLSRNMLDASQGTGEARKGFERLGVSVTDTGGKLRSSDAVMGDIADRFARMEDGAEKTALAMQIFGKSGRELIPMLNQGREGLEEMRAEAEKLGLTLSTEMAQDVEQFNDQMTRIKGAMSGAKLEIVSNLVPAMTTAADRTYEWVEANRELIALNVNKYVTQIETSFRGLYELYSAVPDDARSGIGILGVALLGKKYAVAMAAFMLIPKLLNTAQGAAHAFKGELDWSDFARMGPDELAKALSEINAKLQAAAGEAENTGQAILEGNKLASRSTEQLVTIMNNANLPEHYRELAREVLHFNNMQLDAWERSGHATRDYTKEIGNAGDSTDDAGGKFEATAEQIDKVTAALSHALQFQVDYAREQEYWAGINADVNKAMQNHVETVEDLAEHYRRKTEMLSMTAMEQDIYNAILRMGTEATTEQIRAVTDEIKAYHEKRKALEGNIGAERKRVSEVRRTSSEVERMIERMLGNIQDAAGSTFRKMLDNGVSSFKDLGKSFVDIMKDSLAQIMAYFAQTPIIIPLQIPKGGK